MAQSTENPPCLPFGSWPSEVGSNRIAAGALRLGQPQLAGGVAYWLEGRPTEGGRQALVSASLGVTQSSHGAPARASVEPADVLGREADVRTRVHEYGGGDYLARDGRVFRVELTDQTLREVGAGDRGQEERILTEAGVRYADFDLSPDGRWLVAVEERHGGGDAGGDGGDRTEPSNHIVALQPGAPAAPHIGVATAHDFVSFPRFSPDGRRLAFTAWNHPNMPWDGTELYVLDWDESGPAGVPRRVAGGPLESIFQPAFSPEGRLTFVSDRTGWWNLYREEEPGRIVPLCSRDAEFGRPQWVFGMSSYAYVDEETLLCSYGRGGGHSLAVLDAQSAVLRDLDLSFTAYDGVHVEDGRALFIAASATRAAGVYVLDLARADEPDALTCLRSSLSFELPDAAVSVAEEIAFPSENGRTAYAFYYPPTSAHAQGRSGERPPLLVKSHGGPTLAVSAAFDLRIQYWTSRGFAVVDVNYGGSTGYGREYRDVLRGAWGVVDVEDCCAAARYLAETDRADPARLAITGGSAGGYTTLCALTFTDVFAAGASHYGIGDLEALARDTHKFEARYLDSLVGPYPAARARYVARSPIHATEGLDCPVIFFQGLEDKVVPPNQAESMMAALGARHVRRAYVPFEGEGHGFRRAENIATALDGELYFYSVVFGFEGPPRPPQVEILE